MAVPLLAAVVLVTGGGRLFSATATPKPNFDQVRTQVFALREQAEAASEKYDALQERITGLNVQVSAAQARLAAAHRAVQAARASLGRVAADTYKAGDLATLSLFLSDNPSDYLARSGLMVTLGDQKAEAVRELLRNQQLQLSTMTDLQEQQQKLDKARRDLLAARQDVQKRLDAATALLEQLTVVERGQLGAQQVSQSRSSLAQLGVRVPASGLPSCDDVPVVAPNARVAKVLAYACAHVGAPYQWAGTGPRSFDCSGLTMMAWQSTGVSLPHNAAMQSGYGTTVSSSSLRPGDLLFFHSPISHVGIYLGDGVMLHAPQTGDVVRLAPVPYGTLVTAVRL